jgi:hypothetical protein
MFKLLVFHTLKDMLHWLAEKLTSWDIFDTSNPFDINGGDIPALCPGKWRQLPRIAR